MLDANEPTDVGYPIATSVRSMELEKKNGTYMEWRSGFVTFSGTELQVR